MFPLSCACVHTCCEMSAHKKTWSTHKFSFKKCFCTHFIHVVTNIDECWYSVAHKRFCVPIYFKKLEGTLHLLQSNQTSSLLALHKFKTIMQNNLIRTVEQI